MPHRVAIILSRNGRFSPDLKTGAVEMTAADIALTSAYCDQIEVVGREQVDDAGNVVPTYPGVHFRPITFPNGGSKAEWHKALWNALSPNPPDTIIIQQSPSTVYFFKRKFLNSRIILHRHDAQKLSLFLKRWFQNFCMSKADLILANSAFTQMHHINNRRQNASRVKLLYVPANIPTQHEIQRKQKIVTCVAAMVPKKGALLFAEAMHILAPLYPEWKFVFVSETGGKAPDVYREKIWSTLKALPENIQHYDFLPHDEILSLYKKSMIAVVPSQCDESFGRTAAEAAACGCAIVHSNRGGLPEVTGPDGVICESQTGESYARAIEHLMNDPAERIKRGTSTRAHAIATYSMAKIGKRFDELIFDHEAP